MWKRKLLDLLNENPPKIPLSGIAWSDSLKDADLAKVSE